MASTKIKIEVYPLRLNLKTVIRHASATRHEGESIWVHITRNGMEGFGEGCPRTYSAGDDLESSVAWINDKFINNHECPESLDDLKAWIKNNSTQIDMYPSAWCALEMALLDLFSRETKCSVEEYLGLKNYKRSGRYSAVLPDDKTWKYTVIADKFLIRGLTDFKIKLRGKVEKDRQKLNILYNLCEQHGIKDIRIRLDANNYWKGKSEEAIDYIKNLGSSFFAVEEPVGSRDIEDIKKVSLTTGLPVILDESLCTLDNLIQYKNLPGKYIANIKISRIGGIFRALEMIDELKKMNWPVIIGCHVGETSLLTRAALIIASYAGESLIAHEGAFGDYLIDCEPAEPVLKFGRHGLLDLCNTYYIKNVQGLKSIPPENWNIGFGMDCRVPGDIINDTSEINYIITPDNYKIHYRTWGKKTGDDVILILHGGMSHSLWQAPLAEKILLKAPDVTVAAADRRGCGLNEGRGDLYSVQCLIDDLVLQIDHLKKSFKRIHLAGWCQGSQYAAIAAEKKHDDLSSLILFTPGFFWNDRFRSILRISEKVIMDMIDEFGLSPERDRACIPLPMEAADFTLNMKWHDFIESDTLKTKMITLKTVSIMDEIQELSWSAILNNRLPLLAILAENDRIVDNNKVMQFIGHMFSADKHNRHISINSGHAIQFEKPDEVADAMLQFIKMF
jgi:L-alanine-DL-glutamate epimerase-like enolase superfamily enzyme/pimeloyl-ACP methyl ester carboxylesterase